MGNSIEPERKQLIESTQCAIHSKDFHQLTEILEKPSTVLLKKNETHNNLTLNHYLLFELLKYNEEEIAAISPIIVKNHNALGPLNTVLPVISHHSLVIDNKTGDYMVGNEPSMGYLTDVSVYDVHLYKKINPETIHERMW